MLSERQLEVVLSVVYDFIRTNEPVGSRNLSRRYLTGRSAATIRNEMADLEEMGYLEQLHTSSGRIPTARAYRTYVDAILQRHREPRTEFERWIDEVCSSQKDVEGMLAHISHMLSRATSYIGVAALAPLEGVRLARVDFVRVASATAVAIVVLEGGLVHHRTVSFPCEIGQEELDALARRVNTIAVGRFWSEVRDDLARYVTAELADKAGCCRAAISEIEALLSARTYRFFTGSSRNLLRLPDFRDLGKLEAMLSLLEEEAALANLVERCSLQKGVAVSIGEENDEERMRECSMVIAPALPAGRKAFIGLIGPVRMDYENAIGILEAVLEGLRH